MNYRFRVPRAVSRLMRDPYLLYTAAVAPVAMLALVAFGARTLAIGGLLSIAFVLAQTMLGQVPSYRRRLKPVAWSLLRLGVVLLFIAMLNELAGVSPNPLVSLYLPVVVAAAALGVLQAIVIGGLAAMIYLTPELSGLGTGSDVAQRGIVLAGVSLLLAIGTRRLVATVQQTALQLRRAVIAERRRSRQIAGLEVLGRLLATGGPTAELLDRVLGVLVNRFGYAHVAIYLVDGDVLKLGAQRGYVSPMPQFDGSAGVVGRVMRSRQLAFVADVRTDADYLPVDPAVRSEICAPLDVDGQFLGILNVEATKSLDRTDRDLVATLAGRMASAVALGRDRQALAERAGFFRRLHDFGETINASLALDRLADRLTGAVAGVVSANMVAVTVLDRSSGRYLVRAATDAAPELLGREIKPGEGLAGRAIRDRGLVVDEQFGPQSYPAVYRSDRPHAACSVGVGVPLIRDGVVVGALTIGRYDATALFRPIELEVLGLIASQAALALANAFLHAEVEELAIRDPLTGLYNRRYFEEAFEQLLAARRRSAPAQRRPLVAIMFDLDHFGRFNKQHGHQVGDLVLREVAQVLGERFRKSDIVARMGGEEFVAVLDSTTLDDGVRIANDVRQAISSRILRADDGEALSIRVSAGCAQLDEADPSREQILRTADVALFMAKRAGRDQVVAA